MTTSTGMTRYWLKVFDNTVVVNEHELEFLCAIAQGGGIENGRS